MDQPSNNALKRNSAFLETPESGRRELTVLSLSLRGFARLAETAPVTDIMEFLGAYFGQLEAMSAAYGGRFVRSLGDTVSWVHGLARTDHATHACHTAIELTRRIRLLQTGWLARALPPLDIDIGISTGLAVANDFGTDTGIAVVGDVVDFAAHLRSLNMVYGTHVLLSESAIRHTGKDLFKIREIDVLQIRGRPEPVRLYELILPQQYPDTGWLTEFGRGYDLFRAGLRSQARLVFQHLAEIAGDPVSRCLLERCTGPRRRQED